jgi:hypothetical protein
MGHTPPRVFWKKRLQSIENKGRELRKERQETSRGGNELISQEIVKAGKLEEFGAGEWLKGKTVK